MERGERAMVMGEVDRGAYMELPLARIKGISVCQDEEKIKEILSNKKVMMVTGHRPQHLWGYDMEREEYKKVKEEIRKKLEEHGTEIAISGMALGIDMIFAEAALESPKVKNLIAAIPCLNQESIWQKPSREDYYKILRNEKTKTYYVTTKGYSKEYMQARNRWMVDRTKEHGGEILAVWNGKPGGTGNCVRYARSRGMKPIIISPEDIGGELQGKSGNKGYDLA